MPQEGKADVACLTAGDGHNQGAPLPLVQPRKIGSALELDEPALLDRRFDKGSKERMGFEGARL